MLTLSGLNPRKGADYRNLANQIGQCMTSLGATGNTYEELDAKCTDPTIGAYLEVFGIDRLCDYRNFTAEEIRNSQRTGLIEQDHEFLGGRIEDHISGCLYCLDFAFNYLVFVGEMMPRVRAISRLQTEKWERDVSSEEMQDLEDSLVDEVYDRLVSAQRMLEMEKFRDEISEVPCESPRLWKRISKHGLLKLANLLTQSDESLRRRKVRLGLSLAQRGALLHELSDHVEICLRCSCLKDYEYAEDELIQKVIADL